MPKEPIEKHIFEFNPEDNGGEKILLETKFFPNGDKGGVFLNQSLTLHSYSNRAELFFTIACFSPESLRKLADELEISRAKAVQKTL